MEMENWKRNIILCMCMSTIYTGCVVCVCLCARDEGNRGNTKCDIRTQLDSQMGMEFLHKKCWLVDVIIKRCEERRTLQMGDSADNGLVVVCIEIASDEQHASLIPGIMAGHSRQMRLSIICTCACRQIRSSRSSARVSLIIIGCGSCIGQNIGRSWMTERWCERMLRISSHGERSCVRCRNCVCYVVRILMARRSSRTWTGCILKMRRRCCG